MFDGADSYPVYDDVGDMIAFIHYYCINGVSTYQVFTDELLLHIPIMAVIYIKQVNIRILVVCLLLNSSELDELVGVSSINDYVEILDAMEKLLSKYHDAFLNIYNLHQ